MNPSIVYVMLKVALKVDLKVAFMVVVNRLQCICLNDFMTTSFKSRIDLYQVCYYQNQKIARLKAFPLKSQTSEIDKPSQIMRFASVQLNRGSQGGSQSESQGSCHGGVQSCAIACCLFKLNSFFSTNC
jgi:hypothetical protein